MTLSSSVSGYLTLRLLLANFISKTKSLSSTSSHIFWTWVLNSRWKRHRNLQKPFTITINTFWQFIWRKIAKNNIFKISTCSRASSQTRNKRKSKIRINKRKSSLKSWTKKVRRWLKVRRMRQLKINTDMDFVVTITMCSRI